MVLAQIIKRKYIEQDVAQGFEQGYEQGFAQGFKQGVELAHREHTIQLEAWAKEKGIPFDDLPKLSKPKFRKLKSKRD